MLRYGLIVSLLAFAPTKGAAAELYWTTNLEGTDGAINRANTSTLLLEPVILTGLLVPSRIAVPIGSLIADSRSDHELANV